MSAIISSLVVKVRAVADANIALTGLQTIDFVVLAAGDRVLVARQTTRSQNGIYVVAAGAWSRATDFDAAGEMLVGGLIPVSEGTAYAGTAWIFVTPPTITIGVTALTFLPTKVTADLYSGETLPAGATSPFPNPSEEALDYDAETMSLVASQYRKSPRFLATASMLVAPFQALEDCLVIIPTLDDPVIATGNIASAGPSGRDTGLDSKPATTPGPLDVTGELVGQGRTLSDGTALDDADYRVMIGARILRNKSIGSSPEFLDFLVFVFGVTPFRYYDLGAMTVGIEIGTGASPSADEIALLDDGPTTRAMAVGVGREWYDPAGWFAFAEDTAPNAKGFTEIGDPTQGAQFSELF